MEFLTDPLGDGISKLQLINHMGNDLSVINAAKASYNRESSVMGGKEIKLMNTLLSGITEPQHTAPLRHVVFTFQVKAPIAVCRQWWKHVIASAHIDEQIGWNETSFRYTTTEEQEFYTPVEFRTQSKANKQCSAEVIEDDKHIRMLYEAQCADAGRLYKQLLAEGVSREQARLVLPPAFYTTFIWTVSLQSLLHFIDLREGHGASLEIAQYAICLRDVVHDKCPIALCCWEERKKKINDKSY